MLPLGSKRQAVRRRFDSISSRLLHITILDFRLRLVLLAALTLPFILLGGLVHAVASGHPWGRSAYLVYGLLFRVPALGAVRLDEPAASALVLNAVFLFGTFGFAILIGLIGEEVKGTVKALRAGGAPLDLYGHVVLLNFTADATAVALLRQLAKDVGRPGSPLYGRPIVVLAARPLPPAGGDPVLGRSATVAAAGGGGGAGDVEGAMKRVVADALQGRGACEWHLRVGSCCRTDDLARVCAATASYVVLLADPRVAAAGDAAAAGAAFCLQAQALMCLATLSGSLPHARSGTGSTGGMFRSYSRGRIGTGAAVVGWGGTRGRPHPTIVVQSPADTPQRLGVQGEGGGGPISTFRSVVAAEGSRTGVIEVRDRGIVDRLVAQTVLQPGVATVLARLFSGSAGQGTGFRWIEWVGAPPANDQGAGKGGGGSAAATGVAGGGGSGGRHIDAMAPGLRRRRTLLVPRTLSYSSSQSLAAAAAVPTLAAAGKGGGAAAAGAVEGAAAAGSGAAETVGEAASSMSRAASAERSAAACLRPGVVVHGSRHDVRQAEATRLTGGMTATMAVAVATGAHPKTPLSLPGVNSSTYGEVRQAIEAAADAAAAVAAGETSSRSARRTRQPSFSGPTGGCSGSGSGSGSAGSSPQPPPEVRSYISYGCSLPMAGGGQQGLVLVGYLSAATGTLRLNPRDTSPVYPGDQLLLLVSEHDPAVHGTRRRGWALWSRRDGVPATKRGPKVGRVAVAAAAASALVAAANRDAGGGRSKSSKPAAAAPRPLLQGWHSLPNHTLGSGMPSPSAGGVDDNSSVNGVIPCPRPAVDDGAVVAISDAFEQPQELHVVNDVSGAAELVTPEAGVAELGAAEAGARKPTSAACGGGADTGGVRGSAGGARIGREAWPPRRPPPAPPSHIIVISRTAAAVREVVAGLQEFAPAGSTIALVTHEPPTPTPPAPLAPTPAVGGADAPSASRVGGPPPPSPPPSAAAAPTAPAVVVLPCPSSSWPVREEDLVLAGVSLATSVLVARDGGLQPHEADATALGAVLQLYHTLTDPTKSPLRRWPAPAAAGAAGGGAGGATPERTPVAGAPAPPASLTPPRPPIVPNPANRPAGVLDGPIDCRPPEDAAGRGLGASATVVSTAAAASELAPPPPPPGVSSSVTTATGTAAATMATMAAAPAALHVVVCLYSTRARETLRGFLSSLAVKPPFTLEALVPEEYRALLLAGVVRQPQSHAIMTDLLSDRPGSPEVYLVPPARLLSGGGLPPEIIGSPLGPLGPHPAFATTATTTTGNQAVNATVPGVQAQGPGHHQAGCLGLRPLGDGVSQVLLGQSEGVGSAGWRFRDVAQAARACGCTAIGVLQGGDGDEDGGAGRVGAGGLLLAPPAGMLLELAAGDRLVVLAADPV